MSDRSATAKYAVASDITQFTRGPMDGDRGCDFVVEGIKTGNDAGFDESTWFDGCYEPGPAGTEVASPPASAASAPAAASVSPRSDGADRDTQRMERVKRAVAHYAYAYLDADEQELRQALTIGVALGHFRGIDEYVTLDEHD